MKVELNFKTHWCTVTKELSDPRFTRGGWSCGAESTFLYHVKRELQRMGYDVIKKRMWKDGNLVDDTQQYVRSRNIDCPDAFAIYNDAYAIFDLGERFNERESIDLPILMLNE
jgi:hypothetical protein